MASKRHKLAQQTQEQPSLIAGFKDTHYKETTGWVSKLAENHHAMMIAELNARKEAGASSVDEAEILKKVLGEHRGHTNGVGQKLKAVSRYPDFSTQQVTQQDEIKTVKRQLSEWQQYNEKLLQALQHQVPNFQPPPMPSFFSGSSQQSNGGNDDEEISDSEYLFGCIFI